MRLPFYSLRNLILLIGLAQGLGLLIVNLILLEPSQSGRSEWIVSAYSVIVLVGLALELSLSETPDRRPWFIAFGLLLLFFFLGFHAGWGVEPEAKDSIFTLIFSYSVTAMILFIIVLPFLQTGLGRERFEFPYTDLFRYSWHNALTLFIASVITGLFWFLLLLWAALFALVKVDFFADLFSDKYFVYPVTGTVFGFSVLLGRTRENAVVTLRQIMLTIFKGLLPLVSFIAVLFAVSLPIIGLKPLWDMEHSTVILLLLQFCLILFLNAVYQDGEIGFPYPRFLRWGIQASVLSLPLYMSLCAYALYLRIGQHGWSVNRFWGVLMTVIFGLYGLGYAAAVFIRKRSWMGLMSTVNVRMAVVVMLLMALVNTPVLNPFRLTVQSQIERLMSGKTPAEMFDYNYFRFSVGRYGYQSLKRLKGITGHPQETLIREKAKAALALESRWGQSEETVESLKMELRVYPEGKSLDPDWLHFVVENKEPVSCQPESCSVVQIDLNEDGHEEYLWLGSYEILVYTCDSSGWKRVGQVALWARDGKKIDREEIKKSLMEEKNETIPSPWRSIKIGDSVYPINESSY